MSEPPDDDAWFRRVGRWAVAVVLAVAVARFAVDLIGDAATIASLRDLITFIAGLDAP